LDLDQPEAADFAVLRDVFKFHPLAVEDSEHFDQRAKIDDYDDFIFVVVYGATPDEDRLVEVHCFYSERFLLTIHRDDCPAFAEIRRRYQRRNATIDQPSLLLYRVVDGLVDSFFPILAAFDDRIDELTQEAVSVFCGFPAYLRNRAPQHWHAFDLTRRLAREPPSHPGPELQTLLCEDASWPAGDVWALGDVDWYPGLCCRASS
jgi:hypothetical protein